MNIKNFLSNVWSFVSRLWKTAGDEVQKLAPIAINVVNAVKFVNESTTGDVIELIVETVIPGNAEDKVIDVLRAKLKDILPVVIVQLNIANSIAKIKDPNEQLKAILSAINISSDETKNAYYHSLSVLILQALSDGKLTWGESVQIAEYYYTNIYKGVNKNNSSTK